MRAATGDGKERGLRSRAQVAASFLAAVVVAACISLRTPIEPQSYHRIAQVPGAEAVGADECTVCHEEVQRRSPVNSYHGDCETCHGLGGLHVDSEETAEIRFPGAADCLACHESGSTGQLAWSTGEHSRAGLLCSDCHDTHNRELRNVRRVRQLRFPHMDDDSTLCVSCHRDVASSLSLPSHHPVREGMLGCTSCHAPHGDRRIALGAPTALCAGCHQDYVGPWIYEHAPVAEDCSYCHAPHGAASSDLLETSQPAICLSCHTLADDRHFRAFASGVPGSDPISSDFPTSPSETIGGAVGGAFYTRCTDCHAAIHGSYEDPHLRR